MCPLILVDTSVWIEFLNGKLGSEVTEKELFDCATCGPIVQEVVQGLREDPQSEAFAKGFRSLPVLSDPVSLDLFLAAADIYRQGRAKGFSIRTSIDCLIAAIAIENKVPLWHRDRDFDMIAEYTPLRTYRRAILM